MSKKRRKLDPRVRRTRQMLRDALIKLIAEHGFDAISVQDITDRADLNRTTFYLHYADKHDLLTHSMDDIYEELIARAIPPETNPDRVTTRGPLANIAMMFEHAAEHAAFYRVMLGPDGSSAFVARVRLFLESVIVERLAVVMSRDRETPVPRDLVVRFLASAYLGMLVWWLENDQPYTPDEMAAHAYMLAVDGPYQALGLDVLLGKNPHDDADNPP